MKRLSIEEIEKMTNSKLVSTQVIEICDPIFNDEKKHSLKFDIFDGFAYCANYKGEEYWMDFPKKSFIKKAKAMEDAIREYTSLGEDAEITEKEIMISYNTLYKNSKV